MKTLFALFSPTPLRSTFGLLLIACGIDPVLCAEPSLPTPTPTPPALIANISSRVQTEKKDAVSVTEFSVQGPAGKYVLLRGLGPSLRGLVPDAIPDPVLTLLDAQGNVLAVNNNWVDSPDRDAIIATGLPPTNKRESAIVYTLDPGIYTAVVKDAQGRSGTCLAEVYDLQLSDLYDYFSALGVRAQVLTDTDVMISGMVIVGNNPISVLIRALGPSLSAAGVPHVLSDPVLELHDASGTIIATNDNWMDSPDRDEIIATGLAPTDDLESAILVTLNPGAYTTVVYGVNNATGIAFLQTYSLAIPGPELAPNPIIHR